MPLIPCCWLGNCTHSADLTDPFRRTNRLPFLACAYLAAADTQIDFQIAAMWSAALSAALLLSAGVAVRADASSPPPGPVTMDPPQNITMNVPVAALTFVDPPGSDVELLYVMAEFGTIPYGHNVRCLPRPIATRAPHPPAAALPATDLTQICFPSSLGGSTRRGCACAGREGRPSFWGIAREGCSPYAPHPRRANTQCRAEHVSCHAILVLFWVEAPRKAPLWRFGPGIGLLGVQTAHVRPRLRVPWQPSCTPKLSLHLFCGECVLGVCGLLSVAPLGRGPAGRAARDNAHGKKTDARRGSQALCARQTAPHHATPRLAHHAPSRHPGPAPIQHCRVSAACDSTPHVNTTACTTTSQGQSPTTGAPRMQVPRRRAARLPALSAVQQRLRAHPSGERRHRPAHADHNDRPQLGEH